MPFVVTVEAWLRDYPGLTPQALAEMNWNGYLELRAVRRGRGLAMAVRNAGREG